MSEELTEIIHPDRFVDTSVQGLIRKLSDASHEPTDGEIASLILQYMHTYCREPKNPIIKAPLTELSYLFQILEYCLAHTRFIGAIFDISRLPQGLVRLFQLCEKHGYALGMLGDVASTTEIVRSIIMRQLDVPKSGEFRGLDIGSGSGILSLAQYIMARRNNFRTISIDGIEKNVHVARHSERILRDIIPGSTFEIKGADATAPATYKKYKNPPSFVSVEMIPMAGSRLSPISSTPGLRDDSPDPLLSSLHAFAKIFPLSMLDQTGFFPNALMMTFEDQQEREQSLFCLTEEHRLLDVCAKIRTGVNDTLHDMFVEEIMLSPDEPPISTNRIGANILQTSDNPDGWVRLHPLWRYRWRDFHKSGYLSTLEDIWSITRSLLPPKSLLQIPALNINTIISRPKKL